MNWKQATTATLGAALFAVLLPILQTASTQANPANDYANTRPGVQYVGDQACAECHRPQYDNFKKSGMGNSLSTPGPASTFEYPKRIEFEKNNLGVAFSVSLRNGKLIHSESKKDAAGVMLFTESHEVAYTVGSGYFGRSYLVQKGDALFVSPISYYRGIRGWDLSPGYEAGQFADFTRPAGDLCVGCHSGVSRPVAGSRNRYLQPPIKFLAIGCERCHGPGEVHVRERKANAELKEAIDHSIVNPRRLAWPLRNDVCNQCHLAGDARVLHPGKSYSDFRPSLPLDSVVSIFSAQLPQEAGTIKALSHPEQLAISRCTIASKGKLGCITCHDPHVRLVSGPESAMKFRQKCLSCHGVESCALPTVKRQGTIPADSCIACHMPKRPASNIDHSALTDHRIPRLPALYSSSSEQGTTNSTQLVRLTEPAVNAGSGIDLRTEALAYFEVSQLYPEFQKNGFELLERAAHELPDDAEIQADYGVVLSLAHPEAVAQAAGALRQAIRLGSKSVEVRVRLAKLELRMGNEVNAVRQFKEAIEFDAFYTPAYLSLADLYLSTGHEQQARTLIKSVLAYDPGNESARKRLSELPPQPRN